MQKQQTAISLSKLVPQQNMMYHDMSREEQRELKDNYLNAAKEGNLKHFIDCIDRGVPIETVISYKDTALHNASLNGRLNIVQYLFEICNVDVDARNIDGWTPLHIASACVHIEIFQCLIESYRIKNNFDDIDFDAIIDTYERTTFHFASSTRNIDIVKYLHTVCNCNVNLQDRFGRNALHCSLKYGNFDIVKYLTTECNIDINAQDNHGRTALHYASKYRYIDVAKYLINDCNANINIPTKDGFTALHFAIQKDKIEIIKYLIDDVQADITITTNNGENIFDFIYESKYRTEIVVMLLQRLRQQPKRGWKRKMGV
jgi:ankyrin repeat protein